MRINAETIALVKEFEGCELAAYRDAVGVWTIGYGHSERAPLPPKPYDGMVITMDQAHKILQDDLTHFGKSVENLISVPVTDNQFGAMVSLAFNIGIGAFGKSTALKRLNAGDYLGAAEAMTWWNKAGGKVMRGLVRRREAERALFLTEHDRFVEATPTPDTPRENPTQSTTIQAGGAVGVIGAAGGVFSAISDLDPIAQAVAVAGGLVLVGLGAYIIRERLQKWAAGVR